MLPSQFSEVQIYPNLKRLLQAQVDMQFIDLRTLLRLPQNGLEGGCNFTAAAVLLNLIAGVSVCFHNPSEEALLQRKDRGQRFTALLKQFYPWQEEPLGNVDFISALYESTRNPLAHSLGLDTPPKNSMGRQIALYKWPLNEKQINELEDSQARPAWVGTTIIHQRTLDSGYVELVISVPTLYWGVHRMLHALFADSSHATAADALAKAFSSQWDKHVSETGHCNDTVLIERKCANCDSELVPAAGQECPECVVCSAN